MEKHHMGQRQRPQVLFNLDLVIHSVHANALPARKNDALDAGRHRRVAEILALLHLCTIVV